MLPVRCLSNVQADEEAFTTGFIDLSLELLALLFQNVADHDLGPLSREEPSFLGALSTGAATYQSNLTF